MSKYHTPPGDGLEPIVREFQKDRRQMREQARPEGTRIAELVAKVRETLQNINASVIAAIEANSYTKSEINARIASPPGGVAAAGTVSAGADLTAAGNFSAGGAGTVGGMFTANAGITSANVRSHVVTSGYVSVWVDSAGRIGNTASSLRFKDDIEPADTDALIDSLLSLALVRFRYSQAVEELGDDAPHVLGTIAEYMAETPLREYVSYNTDGEVHGINWEQMGPLFVAAIQRQHSRSEAAVAAIAERLDAAGI